MNKEELDINRIERQIESQKECARYWKSLLRWDYVKDCEKNIEELEKERFGALRSAGLRSTKDCLTTKI